MAGWGAATEGGPQERYLVKAQVPFVDDVTCRDADPYYDDLIFSAELCAGAAVTSSIATSGCTGNASSATAVEVHIKHTYRGDLVIDLLAPDGTAYRLKNSSSSDSADNVDTTYTVNASSEARGGSWKLQVRDVYSDDTGYIDSWSITL